MGQLNLTGMDELCGSIRPTRLTPRWVLIFADMYRLHPSFPPRRLWLPQHQYRCRTVQTETDADAISSTITTFARHSASYPGSRREWRCSRRRHWTRRF